MPVGNDIVDLRDAETEADALHPGFDARVFGPDELTVLAASSNPHRTRWMLWAAKESSYKLVKQRNAAVFFSPVAFAVHLQAAIVVHQNQRFEIAFGVNDDFVHAVATLEGRAEVAVARCATEPSSAVRALACTRVGALLSIDADEIEVQTSDGIPRALHAGALLRVAVSLSHHGRFVACAVRQTD